MSFGGYKHQKTDFSLYSCKYRGLFFAGNNYKLRSSQYQYSMLCLLISLFFQTAIKRNMQNERREQTRSDNSELVTFWHTDSTSSYKPGCPTSQWGKGSLSAYATGRTKLTVLFILTQKTDEIRKTRISFLILFSQA